MKKLISGIIKDLRMLIADYLLLWALELYPKGADRDSLCIFLNAHFEIMLDKGVCIDKDKERRAEYIKNRDGLQ